MFSVQGDIHCGEYKFRFIFRSNNMFVITIFMSQKQKMSP